MVCQQAWTPPAIAVASRRAYLPASCQILPRHARRLGPPHICKCSGTVPGNLGRMGRGGALHARSQRHVRYSLTDIQEGWRQQL